MSPMTSVFPKVSINSGSWERGDFDLTLIQGDPQIHLRLLSDGSQGEPMAGFTCAQPAVFEARLDAYESVYILEGLAEVKVDGAVVQLGPGDGTTFWPGKTSRWTIRERIVGFVVISAVDPTNQGWSPAAR